MMEIEWEDPPPTAKINGRKPTAYAKFVAQLKSNPGRWAKVPVFTQQARTEKTAASLATQIFRGKAPGFQDGDFDAACEGGDVWARFKEQASDSDPNPAPIRTSVKLSDPPAPLVPRREPNDMSSKIRSWARTNGLAVPERGRLSDAIMKSYFLEHPDEREDVPDERNTESV